MGPKKPAPPPKAAKDIPDDGPQLIVSDERERLPPRAPLENVPPLFVPSVFPKECFPEWNDNLELENWGNPNQPYEDPMGLPPLPPHILTSNITWKRPSQYLPPLPEPAKPVAAPIKTPGGGAKKVGAPPPPKKGEPEVKPDELKVPRCCYVLYDASLDPMVPQLESAHPGFAPPLHAERLEWANDFQRVWSAEQAHDIKRWEVEEARIQKEHEEKEAALMAYEEACLVKLQKAIAAHKQATEAELNDEDLLDDGDDGDGTTFDFPTPGTTPSPVLFADIFGSAPVIEIEPNSVTKPTIPEGDYVDPPLASCCRVVSRLVDRLVANQPYYWEAIYPQTTVAATNRRIPIVSPGGKYLVKLFVMGKWRKIAVDDRLPLDDQGKVVVLSSSQPAEIWPSLLAKAIYKVFAWLETPEAMHNPTTVPQSIGFVLNTLTGWKSRPYCGLSDPKAADELGKIAPCLDNVTPTLDVQPSVTMNNVLLLCSMANIITRNFNTSCGEAFVMSSIRTSGPSLAVSIFALHPHAQDALTFTPETIEYHKLTTVVLHTIPTFTHRLVEEWDVGVDAATNQPTHVPFPQALPKFLTVTLPESVSSTTIYVTLSCVPTADSSIIHANDRGMMLVERQHLSDPVPPASAINLNVGLLKPNVTWPFDVQGAGSHVYRLYPHELQFGYSLELEADVPVVIHPVVDCLRDVCRMNVETCEGAYGAMAGPAWHIVHRMTVTFSAPSPPTTTKRRFYLGVHLFDSDAAPYFHIHLVNNVTSTRLSLLAGYFEFDAGNTSESYTVVLECLPGPDVAIPANKFFVTVASDWTIKTPMDNHAVVPTAFEGKYTPNKYLTLFRDVYVPEVVEDPKAAHAVTTTAAAIHTSMKLSTTFANAALKLEVIDLATGAVLVKAANYNNAQIMQLPPCASVDQSSSGYIVQGSFDEGHWHIPDSLRSVQPFYGLLAKDTTTGGPPSSSSASRPSTADSTASPTASHGEGDKLGRDDSATTTMWRLELFSTVPAKLTPDCTTLNKHAAIKHGWEVAERGREVRGAISRLLFLGKKQEAMERMVAAEYTPEQQKELLGRYEFLFGEASTPLAVVGHGEPEQVLGTDFFAAETQKLAQELDEIKGHMDQAARERAEESAARKLEMDAMKQEMADLRQAMLSEREKLWLKREEIRKQQANPTPPSIFP
ncbi:Aste57867_9804 [Aphanomyces stellatus]|uniref:Aste57867_9804 protein n=1 Tax=Aphanomyces stellatus TaxID=120398 RepID=A0A485KNS5_9STRA|nr:hypothetical protein As57867_009765 [Aphanomyces stellatus]VFT86683.1 Aste57867_9804 [Aphanomyces stellatus]